MNISALEVGSYLHKNRTLPYAAPCEAAQILLLLVILKLLKLILKHTFTCILYNP